MKKYRRLNEFYKELFVYRGRHIADTEHSVVRFHERFPHLSIHKWEEVIKKGIDVILGTFRDSKGKYIIINRATNIAVQLEWRKDSRNNDGNNHGFTATTLDFALQKDAIKGDTKLYVEDFKKYKIEKWYDEGMSYEEMMKDMGYYGIKLQECKGYENYIMYGEMKKNFQVIEV